MADETQQFRIAEIEVAKSLSDETIVGIFRFENPGRPRLGPTLLVVADIHSTLYAYERLLDVINSTAEQTRHLVSQVDQDPLGRFEKLVQRLNESVAAFVRDETTPIQWSRINIFALEMSEGHLCFTGIGRLMNTFLQKQPNGEFRPFDLLGSLEQPEQIDPEKPFSSIICGGIGVGDILIAGTSNLDRLRNELRINERLTSLPPVTAAMEIRQDLEKRGVPDDFVAVVVASCEIKPTSSQLPLNLEVEEEETADTPTASIEKLREAEAEANQHLSPVVSPVNRLQDTGNQLKTAAAKIGGNLLGMVKKVRIGGRKEQINDPVALASLRSMNAGYRAGLSKKHKTIGIVVLVIAIAAVSGLIWWDHSKKVAAEIAAWNTTFDSAMDNRNRAESDLVYGNELRARSEIEQAEKIANGIQSPLADRQTKLQKLTQDLKDLRERLKKVAKVEDVAELYSAANSATGSLGGILLTKDYAYTVDNASGEIIRVALTTRETKRIPLPAGAGTVVAADEGKDSILFSTSEGKLLALSKTTDLVKPMAWSHVKSSSTQDAVLYGGKMYSLDPSGNQIWRYTNSGGSFGGESEYIKAADVSISGAVSMSIDSNVYVLKNDGTLLQFLSGAQVSFSLSNIDPPLRAASSLWAVSDSNIFVITDPAEKRILVYEKNGSLKAQLTSSQFHDLRDATVDEASKRIVAIDGNRLISVPLP